MLECQKQKNVILLCDSWYMKVRWYPSPKNIRIWTQLGRFCPVWAATGTDRTKRQDIGNQLLWTENVLVAVQLHGKKPERNRTDGKPEQYRILCHEHFVISGNRYFWPVSWKTVENGIKSQHILRALKQLIYRQEYHL